ncbi:hypothetical protein JOM56_006075 [Amanita muscaria]
MGSLCSRLAGTHTEAHVLQPVDGNEDPRPYNPRAAAAAAAEQRLRAAHGRGTHPSNPNQGRLAAQAAKPVKTVPEPKQEEQLVWD